MDRRWNYRGPLAQKNAGIQILGSMPGSIGYDVVDPLTLKRMEGNFINDAVKTWTYNVPRKIPIIPKYDALKDRATKSFIKSPLTKTVLNLTLNLDPDQEPPAQSRFNKLSARRRCMPSPPPEQIEDLEKSFVNDAIITEKLRTKYKDTLLTPYNALTDPHCREYFSKEGVQATLAKTLRTTVTGKNSSYYWKRSSSGNQSVSRYFSSNKYKF